jgi:fatty acid desaturase
MNAKQIVLGIVLVVFGFESAWAVAHFGYVGFFEELLASSFATHLVGAALLIALALVAVWMWSDARERGATVWPYLVLTAALGSVGPLLYLIRREAAQKSTAGAPKRAAQPA